MVEGHSYQQRQGLGRDHRVSGQGGAEDRMVGEEQARNQEASCLEGLYTSIIHSRRMSGVVLRAWQEIRD